MQFISYDDKVEISAVITSVLIVTLSFRNLHLLQAAHLHYKVKAFFCCHRFTVKIMAITIW